MRGREIEILYYDDESAASYLGVGIDFFRDITSLLDFEPDAGVQDFRDQLHRLWLKESLDAFKGVVS